MFHILLHLPTQKSTYHFITAKDLFDLVLTRYVNTCGAQSVLGYISPGCMFCFTHYTQHICTHTLHLCAPHTTDFTDYHSPQK